MSRVSSPSGSLLFRYNDDRPKTPELPSITSFLVRLPVQHDICPFCITTFKLTESA